MNEAWSKIFTKVISQVRGQTYTVLQTACHFVLQEISNRIKSASDLTMERKPRVLMYDKEYAPCSVCGPNDDISGGRRLGPGMWAFT